jgi:DNA-binding MarR family transcriptional regulator
VKRVLQKSTQSHNKGEEVAHPVALSIGEILKKQSLTKGWFTKIVDRRVKMNFVTI